MATVRALNTVPAHSKPFNAVLNFWDKLTTKTKRIVYVVVGILVVVLIASA